MIGERLGVSLETVRQHIKNIYRKLQVNSRTEVIIKSLKGEL
jgi:DNA-binding NarL/FixJ family response regulator